MSEDNVIQLFKSKTEEIERTEPLTTQELREFKKVLEASVDSFHQLSVMEKYSLYSENINLIFILLELLHPELKEEE